MNRDKIIRYIVPIAFFCIGLLNIGRDLFGLHLDQYAGDLADTRFNNIILEHNYTWLTGGNVSFWSPSFFYPAPDMLAGSDAHFSTTPIYVLFRFLGSNMFSAFQFWILSLFILNFYCCYFALRKFKLGLLAASLGAFLFTFSMPVAGQLFHAQSLCKFAVPLVFYFFYEWSMSLSVRSFIKLNLSYVLLFYSSIYFSLLILIALFFFAIGIFIYKRAEIIGNAKAVFSKAVALRHVLIPLGTLLVCLPIVLKYLEASSHIPPLDKNLLLARLPVWRSYLVTHPGSYWWGGDISGKLQEGLLDPWNTYFGFGYFGLLTLLGGGIYFFRKHVLLAVVCIALGLLILVFTNYGGFSPYIWATSLPGYNHLQAPWRFYLIAIFLIAFVLALVIQLLNESSGRIKLLVPALLVLIVAENFIRTDSLKHTERKIAKQEHLPINDLVNMGKNKNHTAFVLLPSPGKTLSFENIISAMITSYDCELPCVNGYTTLGPKGYCIDWINPTTEQVYNWMHYNGWSDEKIKTKLLIVTLP